MTPLHVFHHIPKCAGNSVMIMLAAAFRIVGDYRIRSSRNKAQWETPGTFRNRAIDLSTVAEMDLLCGHFDVPGCRLWERYPDAPGRDLRRITFLRDPLERAISEFFFAEATGQMETRGDTLAAHLEATCNPVAEWICEDPDGAPDILAGYWFVGAVETLHDDVLRLLRRVGGAGSDPWHVNGAARQPVALSDDLVAGFRARNATDYLLHEMALEGAAGPHLDSGLGVA